MARTSKVKQQICEHAKRLFNEKGYAQVSLREIAEAAGTTIGNLTYHFPQKENLIEAIQGDLHSDFAGYFFIALKEGSLLKNLYQSFQYAQTNEDKNPFYYRNLYELCSDSRTIAQNNEQFRDKLYHYYYNSFLELKRYGLMRADIADETYQSLAYTIVVMATVWIQNTSPYYDEALPTIRLADALSNTVYPYLAETGIQQWKVLQNSN
jgi:AcrR family transcriptional regulator